MGVLKYSFPLSVIADEVFSEDGESFDVLVNLGVVGEFPSISELEEVKRRADTTIMVIQKFFDGSSDAAKAHALREYEKKMLSREIMQPDKADKVTRIYLMRSGVNNLTKIGKSMNPKKREKTLQSEDPKLEMIFHSDVVSESVEAKLHKEYSHLRIRGEWFNLSESDINAIKASFSK